MVNLLALSILSSRFLYNRKSKERPKHGGDVVEAPLHICSVLRRRTCAPSTSELKELLKEHLSSQRYADALSLLSKRVPVAVGKWSLMDQRGAWILDFWHPRYPVALKDLEEPPFVLFGMGTLPEKRGPWLAVVGTRKPNFYGTKVTQAILLKMNPAPQVLVSGLALGVDSQAHVTTLERGITNLGITATDLEGALKGPTGYIAQQILAQGGAIVTEAYPTAPVYRSSFPWRNRIIAALADGLWVVQGTARSGTKSTASYAQTLGREIAATPGDVFSDLSEVPLWLLQNGATPVGSPEDMNTIMNRIWTYHSRAMH